MRFAVILPLLALFVFFRAVWPVTVSLRWRVFWAVLLAAGALFPSVVVVVGGSMVAPVLPEAVMVIGDYLELMVVCAAALTALREVVSLFLRIAPGLPFNRLAKIKSLAAVIAAVAVFATAWGEWRALAAPEVVRVEIAVDGLPGALDGFSVAQVSDLHVSSLITGKRLEKAVAAVNALKPDLIALTGDFADGTAAHLAPVMQALKDLRAPYGVWGVDGNHEHYTDYAGWRELFPKLGVRMLWNAHGVIDVKGTPLVVAGLTDPMAARFGRELPNLEKALFGSPDATVLLLAHQPKLAFKVAGRGVDLQLSGHTHGGQAPGIAFVTERLNAGLLKGLYNIPAAETGAGNLRLYINQGTYLWNGFPLRIGTTGEVTLITLKKSS